MKAGLPQPPRTPAGKWIMTRLRALRAFSLPVSVLPVFVATAAVLAPGQWQWDILLASAAGVALLHAAGNLLNDYFDFRSAVDRKVEGDRGRPGRLLVRGELPPRSVLAEAVVCLILGAAVAGFLTWRCGTGLLGFAAVAFVALYVYTGPPFQLKYRALGEPLIFAVFGPALMLGAAYAQTGSLEWAALWLSVPVGLATTAVLLGNNIRDRDEDAAAGISTLAHVLPPSAMKYVYLAGVAGSTTVATGLGATGLAPPAVIATPVLLVLAWKPMASVWSGRRLPDIDARTARFAAVLMVFILVVHLV